MKKWNYLIVGAMIITVTIYAVNASKLIPDTHTIVSITSNAQEIEKNEEGKSLEPHDQWLTIRSYPNGFDQNEYIERMSEITLQAQEAADSRAVELGLDWQQEGPGNIGGRVNVLTSSPTDSDVIYAGASNGGVFKTSDGGENWTPIFDDLAYLSIGAISINPTDEDIVYVGTGDRNFGGGSHIGNGIYKSENGGATWETSGLEETGVVTEILIDPTDPDRLFASTLGNPFAKNTDRGVYRSEDGGETWTNTLFVSDSSGVIDLIMDPSNPNILYASGYNRMRSYTASTVVGPQARIYKTINGGDSWSELSVGLPMEDNSRIGLAISNVDPSIVYALYVSGISLDVLEIYKSTDAGASWSGMDVHDGIDALPTSVMGGFGWYFGEMYINPYNNDHLVIPGVDMYHSLDGGETWSRNVPIWWTYEVHADKHAITFLDADSYIIATDGGLYKTDNNGDSWTDIENIPITQFYHIEVDPHSDGLYGGGAQDNGSMSGNEASFNDWQRLFGGDGFRVTFLEEGEDAAYFETQNGNITYQDAIGTTINVSPLDEGDDRTNWDTPYLINEETEELYVGTSRIQYMAAAPWGDHEYISDDLTRVGLGDYEGTARYHTITEIDQPYNDASLLYCGTSDGLVWKGKKASGSWDWTNITEDLPNAYVTGVRCSPNLEGTVYVCFSGYKNDESISYLYKTEDFGENWEDISSDLPGITVDDILIVPGYENDEYLFAALDGGVYFSANNGENWEYVGVGLPIASISELHLDIPNERLIAGTYARSMWSYDVSWMEELEDEVDDSGIAENQLKNNLTVYPNPAENVIYFDTVDANQIQLYDQQGRLVLSVKVNHLNGYSQANISELNTGVYYFSVANSTGKIVKK